MKAVRKVTYLLSSAEAHLAHLAECYSCWQPVKGITLPKLVVQLQSTQNEAHTYHAALFQRALLSKQQNNRSLACN